MRTSDECHAKAIDLDQRADACPLGTSRDAFRDMAAHWRRLAETRSFEDLLDTTGSD